jgi:hypothetical protein
VRTFSLKPKNLHMQHLTANNDLLNIDVSITASPVVSFEKRTHLASPVPNLQPSAGAGDFSIHLDAALQYDSLSRIINGYMAGKRFDISEGLLAKHVVVREVTVAGNKQGDLLLKVNFTGSFAGTAFFVGKPVFNEATRALDVQNLDYDLQTKSFLLKGAKWLFASKIETELKKASSINLSTYFEKAQKALSEYLNREWTKGVKGSGTVSDLRLVSTQALPQHLLIRTTCAGNLSIRISDFDLGLNH